MGHFQFSYQYMRPKINSIFINMIFVSKYLFKKTTFMNKISNLRIGIRSDRGPYMTTTSTLGPAYTLREETIPTGVC